MARKVRFIKPANIGASNIKNELTPKEQIKEIREYLYKLTEQIEKTVNSVFVDIDENAKSISDFLDELGELQESFDSLDGRVSKLEE